MLNLMQNNALICLILDLKNTSNAFVAKCYGSEKPIDCKLFARVCAPENPLGSCMVSSEGACAAVYTYGRMNV